MHPLNFRFHIELPSLKIGGGALTIARSKTETNKGPMVHLEGDVRHSVSVFDFQQLLAQPAIALDLASFLFVTDSVCTSVGHPERLHLVLFV